MKYKNIEIRENTYDKKIVDEILKTYSWMVPKDCTVLDIGGCFGGYSFLANEQGAKKIYCFEPEVENYNMCLVNTKNNENTICFNEALVSGQEKEINLYLPKNSRKNSRNKGLYSTTHFRGRRVIKVKAKNFHEVLDELKPDVIKMDCEGSEYDLLYKPLPEYVKKITIEIHFHKKEWRTNKAEKLVKLFEGWQVHKQPNINAKGTHTTIGAWYR
jgi:FkbM family methyltransferase